MLARVRKLEQSAVSPTLRFIGSLEAWEQSVVSSIEGGTLCPRDGPVLFHAIRSWCDTPYQVTHPLLDATRKAEPETPGQPAPVYEPEAAQINSQAEHERLYQEFRKSVSEGARQYLQAQEQRSITQRGQ